MNCLDEILRDREVGRLARRRLSTLILARMYPRDCARLLCELLQSPELDGRLPAADDLVLGWYAAFLDDPREREGSIGALSRRLAAYQTRLGADAQLSATCRARIERGLVDPHVLLEDLAELYLTARDAARTKKLDN